VTLKWAQTIDGKTAWAEEKEGRRWISNELSRKDAHCLRRQVQGILVGIDTVLADDPMLTPRPPKGRKPLRIVLDTNLRIPLTCRLMRTAKNHPTMVVTGEQSPEISREKAERIRAKGAEVIGVSLVDGRCDLAHLSGVLGERQIKHVLVEGGAKVIAAMLAGNLADEICVYIAPGILGRDGAGCISESLAGVAATELKEVETAAFGTDIRITGLTQRGAAAIGIGDTEKSFDAGGDVGGSAGNEELSQEPEGES